MKIELKATNTQWFKKYQLYFLRNMLKNVCTFLELYIYIYIYIYISEEQGKRRISKLIALK
jgi:hypothetical protein